MASSSTHTLAQSPALASPPPPGLQEATKNSTTAWQADLEALFHHAKDRFPDVVWELVDDDDNGDGDDDGEDGFGNGKSVYGYGYKGGQKEEVEEVWGHKAIVYARAPPSFQNRYFSFRSSSSSNNNNNNNNNLAPPEDSSLSLCLGLIEDDPSSSHHLGLGLALEPRTPSPSHTSHTTVGAAHSIRPTTPGGGGPSSNILRLTTSINPSLFSDELEYLYTGNGFGEAFEFLFDSSDTRERERTLGESPNAAIGGTALVDIRHPTGSASLSLSLSSSTSTSALGAGANNAESLHIDKLRKDLVFMWRSRLYSDVRIALTGNFGGGHHHGRESENTTAIFSSHRFILVSRSPYFYNALVAWPGAGSGKNSNNTNDNNDTNEPPTLTLPSPPFTPASLHFTLGFIYTGTLIFSHRSYDLHTSFSLLRSSLYLSLPTWRG